MARGFRTIKIVFKGSEVNVFTSARTADALEEISTDMTLYHGVRLAQVMEAVYQQGRKDGARSAFEEIEAGIEAARKVIPSAKVGRPRGSRNKAQRPA